MALWMRGDIIGLSVCVSMVLVMGGGSIFFFKQHPSTYWNYLHLLSCSWYVGTAQPNAHHRPRLHLPPLDMPVAQETELHWLHPETLLDTAVAQATCTHQSQPGSGDAVAQEEAQSLQCPLWKSWRNWETILKKKKKKKYLGYSSAYMAAVRRKWWAELIGLPVSGPMFSPFRHSWRISCLAVDSAGKKYWEKWFRIPCYKLITWWIYTLKYNIQARR